MNTLDSDSSAWRRAATWLAHFQPVILLAAVCLYLTYIILGSSSEILALLVLVSFVLVVVGGLAEVYHDFRLCPRCALALPIDPQVAIDSQRNWLVVHHKVGPWLPFVWITTIVADFVTDISSWVLTIAFFSFYALSSMGNLRHRPLELWCPYCPRRGWEDDNIDVTTPPPVPAGEKVK